MISLVGALEVLSRDNMWLYGARANCLEMKALDNYESATFSAEIQKQICDDVDKQWNHLYRR